MPQAIESTLIRSYSRKDTASSELAEHVKEKPRGEPLRNKLVNRHFLRIVTIYERDEMTKYEKNIEIRIRLPERTVELLKKLYPGLPLPTAAKKHMILTLQRLDKGK